MLVVGTNFKLLPHKELFISVSYINYLNIKYIQIENILYLNIFLSAFFVKWT